MSGVFIRVLVVIIGMKFSIILFNKEKGGHLRGIGRSDLLSS